MKIGFTATSLPSPRQCHLAAALAITLNEMVLFNMAKLCYIALCYMRWIPTTPNIFSKACTDHFSFLQNSLWAQECRGRQTSGTVQCRYQSPLQSRMDCSPWGCLPKRPGDYWYPGERRCQDWVCKLLWNHFFICGSWEWAVGSSEIPSKVW